MSKIQWLDQSTHYLLNPRDPHLKELKQTQQQLPQLDSHIWLMTSGSTGRGKWVALSKSALLCSAEAVCNFLKISKADRMLKSLPDFHVGGLSQWVRGYVSGAQVIVDSKAWDAKLWCELLKKEKITVSSLVPTQVYDLVQNQLQPNKELRLVIVGGGALDPGLYLQAKKLGWPLLTSYGLTECGSQVATASLESLHQNLVGLPELCVLPHVEVRSEGGVLCLKSQALLTCYGKILPDCKVQVEDPKKEGWLLTEDLVELKQEALPARMTVLGRQNEVVKIKGELVQLQKLRQVWAKIKPDFESHLILKPHTRDGYALTLLVERDLGLQHLDQLQQSINQFEKQVMPFEKITWVYYLEQIPKTSLGKLVFINEL